MSDCIKTLASCQFQYIFGRPGSPLYSYSFLNSAHLTQLLVGKNPLVLVIIIDHIILPTLHNCGCISILLFDPVVRYGTDYPNPGYR
ncbi:hypothetical protein [Moorena sp. SIO3B2]|uniref:hypothetical protein n=1 Tax=Moorena sp. SIO3B2 TaxID=2607827 RepID=UPI0013C5D5CD|nr:hypothetical protein [Moorena sp. SIO3B2]NEP36803.1 hypothetical protein [Moorena sp. SIO3B2]